MSLNYKARKSNIADKEGNKKFYPVLVRRGVASNDEVAEKLSEVSTLSLGDSFCVTKNLGSVFKSILMDGRSVNIEGFGTFTVVCRSKYGVDTFDEVSENQIDGLRVIFTPTGTRTPMEGTTRAMFKGVRFQRIDKKDSANNGSNEGEEDDDFVDPTL